MSENYQLLLAKAAQLYEKHGVGRPEPFNVFSVLHKETDEVNLHSRFLRALLDYKKPGSETRENLKDFLQHVGIEDFELCGANVKRERYNIDILITNADKKAVAIENKTNPNTGDQDKQLWRYYNTLKKKGYSTIHLLYLTLDGRAPSDDGVGNLDRKLIKCISYKGIIPWLERCQKRDENEAALRESVAQYLQLVRKLTNTDSRGKYMEALKKLCLEDRNFVLIHDLHEAMSETEDSVLIHDLHEAMSETEDLLLKKLREEIKFELKSDIQDFPYKKRYYNYNWGLCYSLSGSILLKVIVGPSPKIWFGVVCPKNEAMYDQLSEALQEVSDRELDGQSPFDNYLYWQYADKDLVLSSLEYFELLSNDTNRQKYAKETAQGIAEYLKPVWEVLKRVLNFES